MGLTVQGGPMNGSQKALAQFLLGICRKHSSPTIVMQAMIFAAIFESGISGESGWDSSNPTYGGVLAGNRSFFGKYGARGSVAVTTAEAEGFLNGPNSTTGYRSALSGAHMFTDPAKLAAWVEEPTLPGGGLGADGYGQYSVDETFPVSKGITEAVDIVQQLGGGGATGTTLGVTTGSSTKSQTTAPFFVGGPANPNEDVWTAVNRLAQARYWYLFSDGETLYLADGATIMQQEPALTLDRWGDVDRINHLDFVWDNPGRFDTPVLTTNGWKTLATIEIGDFVYGSDGKPAKVLGGSPIMIGRDCYRVAFDDGTYLDTDGQHPWTTRHRGKYQATTTKDLYTSNDSHYVQVVKPLTTPEVNLPLDPYILGYWLGDGSKSVPMVGIADEDISSFLEQARFAGISTNTRKKNCTGPWARSEYYWRVTLQGPALSPMCSTRDCERSVQARGLCKSCYSRVYHSAEDLPPKRVTITGILRDLNVLDNKHIPETYLFASAEQRWALLQGLMDSDGSSNASRCSIAQVDEQLAAQILLLARGLGFKAMKRSVAPHGNNSKTLHCVSFTLPSERQPPFRLARKCSNHERDSWRSEHKRIVSVVPIESVPVRCIAVDSEDHLFLAGEGLTLTHNTAFQYAADRVRRKRIVRRSQLAKVTSPVEATLNVICDIDAVRAGDVVRLSGCGPGDGDWLIGDCRRSIFQIYSELTLVPALKALSEAQARGGINTTSNADVPGSAASQAGSGTIIAAMISAAATIAGSNNATTPFVSYGGRDHAGQKSIGHPGEGFYDGKTKGYDGPGAVGAVLAAGGFMSGAVPDGAGIISKLRAAKVVQNGQGNGNPECTIFSGRGHVFIRLNGKYWGTNDEGGRIASGAPNGVTGVNIPNLGAFPGGSTNTGSTTINIPNFGPFPSDPHKLYGGSWLNSPPSLTGYEIIHITPNLLGDFLSGSGQSGVASGFYTNPFPGANINPSRVDQGVDYRYSSGQSNIVAMGDGVVGFAPSLSGWGGFVSYTLSNGPYAGKKIYVAENISVHVGSGATITKGQHIADFTPGSIETGWWGGGFSLAHDHGQQAAVGDPGDNTTAYGMSFNRLLKSLGAPPGHPTGPTVGDNGIVVRSGTGVPAGFP